MWDGLDKLLELQQLDLAIAKRDAEARAIPKAIDALEGRLAKAREALAGLPQGSGPKAVLERL